MDDTMNKETDRERGYTVQLMTMMRCTMRDSPPGGGGCGTAITCERRARIGLATPRLDGTTPAVMCGQHRNTANGGFSHESIRLDEQGLEGVERQTGDLDSEST